jgi:hypothetical protein
MMCLRRQRYTLAEILALPLKSTWIQYAPDSSDPGGVTWEGCYIHVLTHGNSMAFLFAPAKMMVIGANLEENNLSHLVVAKWRWDTILVSRAGVGQGFDVSMCRMITKLSSPSEEGLFSSSLCSYHTNSPSRSKAHHLSYPMTSEHTEQFVRLTSCRHEHKSHVHTR